MPGARKRKSEIIRDLQDPERRKTSVSAVLTSPGVRVPRRVLFGDEAADWKEFIVTHKCRNYYRLFSDLRKKERSDFEAATKPEERIDMLRAMSVQAVRRLLAGWEVPRGLSFSDGPTRVFYLSCLAHCSRETSDELALLRALQILYKAGATPSVLKNVFVRFSKMSVAKFLKSSITDMPAAHALLLFVATRLDGSVVELCFEEDMAFEDALLRRLPDMRLSPGVRFMRDRFESLLRYKAFRRFVYNSWNDEAFLVGMADYANRGDYAFFYARLGVEHKPLRHLPADYADYTFFARFDPADLPKIREYQRRHGHNLVLDLFAEEHIEALLDSFTAATDEQLPVFTEVFGAMIRHGNANINAKVWEALRCNEALFRLVVGFFDDPVDPTLHALLTGRHQSVVPRDAECYVKFYYEEELLDYFKGREIAEIIPLMNTWNGSFFMRVICAKAVAESKQFTEADVSSILDAVRLLGQSDVKSVARILDKLMDLNCMNIHARIDKRVQFVYALKRLQAQVRQGGQRQREEVSTDTSDCILERAHAFELACAQEGVDARGSTFPNKLLSHAPKYSKEAVLDSLFELAFMMRTVGKFYFVEYFTELCESINQQIGKAELVELANGSDNPFVSEPVGCSEDRIAFYLALNEPSAPTLHSKVSFLLGFYLQNNCVLYALSSQIRDLLQGPQCSMKALALRFIDPARLCKNETLAFVNAVVPLANSTSSLLCNLSRACLSRVSIENKEVQSILGDLIQALVDKKGVPAFINAFRSLLFNNFLCFNSLCLVIQILLRSLPDHTADAFEILAKLVNITQERDLRVVGPSVFNGLNKFVISNHYHTTEALRVACMYALYASFDDYLALVDHFSVLRISLYVVGLLRSRGDSALNTRLITHVISKASGGDEEETTAVPHAFIGAACELEEFGKHFLTFLPALKRLFVSDSAQKRAVSVKAFQEVLTRPESVFDADVKRRVVLFVTRCSVSEDYPVRLACLDVMGCLPLLFIMRNDQHFLVRKKAYEMWKERVDHPNKLLRVIGDEILDFVRFATHGVFRESLVQSIAEMAVKYCGYLEDYVGNDDNNMNENENVLNAKQLLVGIKNVDQLDCSNFIKRLANQVEDENALSPLEIKEFILAQAVQNGKLLQLAMRFTIAHAAPALFHLLCTDQSNRAELMAAMPEERLLPLCKSNPQLALDLLRMTGNGDLIAALDQPGIHSVLEACESDGSFGALDPQQIPAIMERLESSVAAEQFILKASPHFSFLYLDYYADTSLVERQNCGSLLDIFKRAFETFPRIQKALPDACLDRLVTPFYLCYIKHCSLACIVDRPRLLGLLMGEEDRRSFECVCSLLDTLPAKHSLVLNTTAYLLRNYLADTRKEQCFAGLTRFYSAYGEQLGYFKSIIENSILNDRSGMRMQ